MSILIPGKWITTSILDPRFNLNGSTAISELCYIENVMRQALKEKAKEFSCSIPADLIYELKKYAGNNI